VTGHYNRHQTLNQPLATPKYTTSRRLIASTSQDASGVSVNSFHALICSYVIGFGPEKPADLLLFNIVKADQTCDIRTGNLVGGSNASILRPVCLSTSSKCSRSVVPDSVGLLSLKWCSAHSHKSDTTLS
jgi:hypothetical protein